MDPITIRNYNSHWINQNVINCANYIFDNIHVDYAWTTHADNYNEICNKLQLEKTNFIHVAKKDGRNVGVAKMKESTVQILCMLRNQIYLFRYKRH